jgi:hypothetical protein
MHEPQGSPTILQKDPHLRIIRNETHLEFSPNSLAEKPPIHRVYDPLNLGGGHSVSWKGTLLSKVPFVVVTWTVPLVAPAGTVAVISLAETTVNAAEMPLKVTLVVPVTYGKR